MSRSRRAGPGDEIHDNHERWLLTYSDMITLLMVLFIVLFALGQTNIRKFNAFRQSFHTASLKPAPITTGGLGVLSADNAIQVHPSVIPQRITKPTVTESQPEAAAEASEQQSIEQALLRAGIRDGVTFHRTASGLAVTIATDHILFDTDSAVLLGNGVRIIQALAPVLARLHNDLDIQGHTDDQPIAGGIYASNWELSTARALSVLQYLLSLGLPADRLSATGYGDTRPLVPNTTSADRSENRRVEIVILSQPQPS